MIGGLKTSTASTPGWVWLAFSSSDFGSVLLTILTFFKALWAAAFGIFWYPGGSRNSRASLLPWHVFLGIYIYALAVPTATTGFLEKATFLQTNKAILVNCLGILVVVMGGLSWDPGRGDGRTVLGSWSW
ncbi:hypothetical protein SAY87_020636 [Trapa incisa]|uniref:Cytochrome b561 domain-containing protein n=1 Tax=Trapa incisa TaxID=236973 RepID=A0AAN7JW14_9MYRT|nr:hypothetical protein SAY87_020636 [Trapa incisa]